MTISNPHTETLKAALVRFKELAGSLDGWKFASESQGVRLYSYPANPIIVRGDYVLKGSALTIHQITAVASSPGARKIWDDKFGSCELKAIYNSSEYLCWASLKTPWPVTPRDLSTTAMRIRSDEEDYVVMTSVTDEHMPEKTGHVRAHLLLSGWKITKTKAGDIQVTYITQIDLKGSIPSSFLKKIQIQVPLCAGQVAAYAEKNGFPPYVLQSQYVQFESEDFDHETKTYKATWTSQSEEEAKVEFDISKTMYPQGPKVTLEGNGTYSVEQEGRLLVVSGAVVGLEISR